MLSCILLIIVVWRVHIAAAEGPLSAIRETLRWDTFVIAPQYYHLEHCLPFLCNIFANDNIVEDNSVPATRKSIQRHVSHFVHVVLLDQS